jgi:hypothetical protein
VTSVNQGALRAPTPSRPLYGWSCRGAGHALGYCVAEEPTCYLAGKYGCVVLPVVVIVTTRKRCPRTGGRISRRVLAGCGVSLGIAIGVQGVNLRVAVL